MISPADMTQAAMDSMAWVGATTGAGDRAIGEFVRGGRRIAEEGKQGIKDRTEQHIRNLSAEVAQTDLARNLVNLLI